MKIVNLYGGPGTGKSTTAAGLFHLMKLRSIECELVTEYAKDLVWAERHTMFTEQDYIFAKQNHRLRRLDGKVDWVITDSPIILGFFYIEDSFPGKEPFCDFVRAMFNSYDNINVFLERVKPYNPNGRNQTEDESRAIDVRIKEFLQENNLPYFSVPADAAAPALILDKIIKDYS
jgi:hypothetical protein